MKTKNILQAFLTTVLISVSLLLDAQTKVYVNKKDGTANQYNIADVDSISFAPSSSSTVVDPTPLNMNVSLVASSENSTDIPIVDVTNKTLDLGANPILIIGNKSFALKSLWPSNPEKYRAIPLTIAGSALQRVLYFNVTTNDFEMTGYTNINTKDANRVLIGTVYNQMSGSISSNFNVNLAFPFRYSNLRASVITGSLKNRANAEIFVVRGLNISKIAPENSLDAVELAARAGYNGVEIDLQVTKDGELVVSHADILDSNLVKNAADYSDIVGAIGISSLTLAELQTNYVLASPNPRMRRPIPSLEEMFITCRDNHIKPQCDLKPGITNDLALKAYNLGSGILGEGNFILTFKGYSLLDYLRTISDTVDLMYTTPSILGTVNSITGQSREHPHNIWATNNATAEQVKECKRKNMKVYVFGGAFDDMLNTGAYYIEGGGPNLDGRPGNVLTSDGNWKSFMTSGVIVSDYVLLNNGQYIKWDAKNAIYLSAYYIKITFKGSITLSSARTSVTKTSNKIYTLINQEIIYSTSNTLTVTAKADGTEVYSIEFVSVDL